jgi:hypothetical protein
VMGTDCCDGLEKVFGKFSRTPANNTWGFGAGRATASFQVHIPVRFRDFRYVLTADVVPGPLPLLLSRKDQIMMGGNTYHVRGEFGYGEGKGVSEQGRVPLTETESGHWILPLAWDVPLDSE